MDLIKKLSKIFIVVGLMGMLSFTIMWLLTPDFAMDFFQVSANTKVGINSLKSDMGGFVLTVALFLALYFIKKDIKWLQGAMIATSAILFMRIISLILDGFSVQVLGVAIFEILALTATIIVIKKESGKGVLS